MAEAAVRVALGPDGLRIESAEAALVGVEALCRLVDGRSFESEVWEPASAAGAQGAYSTNCGPLIVTLIPGGTGELGTIMISARARSACEVLEVGFRARPMPREEEFSWYVYSGYQSWDRAGLVRLDRSGSRQESWWLVGLAGEAGSGLGLAALSCERSCTRFEHSGARLAVLQCAAPRPSPASAVWEAETDETWQGDRIGLAPGPGLMSCLDDLAARAARRKEVEPPQGWLSWYRYGPWVAREDVLENAGFLAEGSGLGDLGYRTIQIDDGWQQAYGDWRPNSRFEPFQELLDGLRAQGFRIGIWTAPFLVGTDSQLARTAPDTWFVHEPDGRRLLDPRPGLPGEMYVLDPSNPEVLSHLAAEFGRLRALGFTYFKTDYLYAGAYAGIVPFCQAMRVIREAVAGCYLLACGCPLLPVAGLADGCRVWEDTARPIFNFETGLPQATIFGDEVQWAARNLAARLPMRSWFQLDPDVALVGGNLPVAQARQLVTLIAISGGPFFTTDQLAQLGDERLALLGNGEVLALVGRGPALPDWEPQPRELPPSTWRLNDRLVAVFNWTAEEKSFDVSLPAGRWRCRDLWTGSDLGTNQGEIRLVLPPDGVGLFALDTA